MDQAVDPAALVADLGEDELRASISALCGAAPVPGGAVVSRDVHHPDLLRAADWLIAELGAIDGLVISTQSFVFDGLDPAPFNVIADVPGSESGPVVLLAAHYDAIASADEGWRDPTADPAPGADDDASGVAAVLGIARRLAGWEGGFRHPIRFVFFSAEEYGLIGSTAYVASLPPGEVGAMIQLDSIGYDEAGVVWATYDLQSATLLDGLIPFGPAPESGLTLTPVPAELIGGDSRSDHYPFWEAGIPALHVASFPLPDTYHTMSDTLDTVDVAFTAEVARMVGAFVAKHAEPLAAPGPVVDPGGCGCAGTPGRWDGGPVAGLLLLVRLRRTPGLTRVGA